MAQQIRISQFVVTYGPGAIIEGIEGPRVIPVSDIGLFEPGSSKVPWDYEIPDQRMVKGLLSQSRIYRLPSNAELLKAQDDYIYRTKPFPEWKLCLNANWHNGDFYILYRANSCPICGNTSRRGREAIRFITACPAGHMDEVDWYFLTHGSNAGCQHSGWFRWYGGGGALSRVEIECPECKRSFNLGKAYGQNWPCSGRFPEREPIRSPPIRPGCKKNSRIIQRQASNLRIPKLLTLFSIPPRHTNLHNLLQIRPVYDNIIGSNPSSIDQLRQILLNLSRGGRIGQSIVDEILKNPWSEIQSAIKDVLSPVPTSYRDLILEEFSSLIEGSVQGIPPTRGPIPHSPVVIEVNPNLVGRFNGPRGSVFRITPVLKLRTVTAQYGYQRAVDTQVQPKTVDISFPDPTDPQQKWYPGVEFFGEGIFMIFDENDGLNFKLGGETADKWLEAFDSPSRYEGKDYVFREPRIREELHPMFVWWHTLSHLLIRAIASEAGYSSAAIRERVYLEIQQSKVRGGALLYATQPGSEGTLGGLVALVHDFQDIFNIAFEQLQTCSGDPLCRENTFQGGSYNGAACYSCLLLSETSCDHRNMWLDRNVMLENLP